MEINTFEETKKMYEREIKRLNEEIEEYKKHSQRLEVKIKELEEKERKIEIKEGQCGGLDIRIGNREYLNIPSSKPKSIEIIEMGEFCFYYRVRLKFEWTEQEREYVDIEDEYNFIDMRFKSPEELFLFLQIYLNRFEWKNGK